MASKPNPFNMMTVQLKPKDTLMLIHNDSVMFLNRIKETEWVRILRKPNRRMATRS